MRMDEPATHRHVVEILDMLSESGCNTALLRRFVPVRGVLLTMVAGLQSITRSWEEPPAEC
ncbi:hypothetical protein [Nocardia sp. NPDC004860]|uniref:hypothetical protein n=1 Tax=Nocardia sp. NPDC004860 TaxID=3154557 RepID=UPI0033BC5559